MERWVRKKITRISLSVLMPRWRQIRFCCKNINICIDFFPWFMSDRMCFIYLGVHDYEEIDPFAVLPNLNNSLSNTCLSPGYLVLNFLILSKSLLILLLTNSVLILLRQLYFIAQILLSVTSLAFSYTNNNPL